MNRKAANSTPNARRKTSQTRSSSPARSTRGRSRKKIEQDHTAEAAVSSQPQATTSSSTSHPHVAGKSVAAILRQNMTAEPEEEEEEVVIGGDEGDEDDTAAATASSTAASALATDQSRAPVVLPSNLNFRRQAAAKGTADAVESNTENERLRIEFNDNTAASDSTNVATSITDDGEDADADITSLDTAGVVVDELGSRSTTTTRLRGQRKNPPNVSAADASKDIRKSDLKIKIPTHVLSPGGLGTPLSGTGASLSSTPKSLQRKDNTTPIAQSSASATAAKTNAVSLLSFRQQRAHTQNTDTIMRFMEQQAAATPVPGQSGKAPATPKSLSNKELQVMKKELELAAKTVKDRISYLKDETMKLNSWKTKVVSLNSLKQPSPTAIASASGRQKKRLDEYFSVEKKETKRKRGTAKDAGSTSADDEKQRKRAKRKPLDTASPTTGSAYSPSTPPTSTASAPVTPTASGGPGTPKVTRTAGRGAGRPRKVQQQLQLVQSSAQQLQSQTANASPPHTPTSATTAAGATTPTHAKREKLATLATTKNKRRRTLVDDDEEEPETGSQYDSQQQSTEMDVDVVDSAAAAAAGDSTAASLQTEQTATELGEPVTATKGVHVKAEPGTEAMPSKSAGRASSVGRGGSASSRATSARGASMRSIGGRRAGGISTVKAESLSDRESSTAVNVVIDEEEDDLVLTDTAAKGKKEKGSPTRKRTTKKKNQTASNTKGRRRRKKAADSDEDGDSTDAQEEPPISEQDEEDGPKNVKASNRGGGAVTTSVAAFWRNVESYFTPISDSLLHEFEHEGVIDEKDSAFTIPELGKHYTKRWLEEDQQAAARAAAGEDDLYDSGPSTRSRRRGEKKRGAVASLADVSSFQSVDSQVLTPGQSQASLESPTLFSLDTPGGVAGGGDTDSEHFGSSTAASSVAESVDIDSAASNQEHCLSQRILAALMEENVLSAVQSYYSTPSQQSSRSGSPTPLQGHPSSSDRRSSRRRTANDTDAVMTDENNIESLLMGSNTTQRATGEDQLQQPAITARDFSHQAMESLQDRLMRELRSIGVLTVEDTPQQINHELHNNREDDEISIEIRALQSRLRDQMHVITEKKHAMLTAAHEQIPEERSRELLKQQHDEVDRQYKQLTASKTKKKKGRR